MGTRWRWVISFTLRLPYTSPRNLLGRNLGGTQKWEWNPGRAALSLVALYRLRYPSFPIGWRTQPHRQQSFPSAAFVVMKRCLYWQREETNCIYCSLELYEVLLSDSEFSWTSTAKGTERGRLGGGRVKVKNKLAKTIRATDYYSAEWQLHGNVKLQHPKRPRRS
jgi:hypothetical protein